LIGFRGKGTKNNDIKQVFLHLFSVASLDRKLFQQKVKRIAFGMQPAL
jgi:hypothetical protein